MRKSAQWVLLIVIGLFLVRPMPVQGEIPTCGFDQSVDEILNQSELTSWLYWVEVLSGEQPAQLDGFPVQIRTRKTTQMFDGSSDTRAYDYLLQQMQNWYPDNLIIEHSYSFGSLDAKNLIVTIPGVVKPDEYVLLVAHLDDTSWNAARRAPGANDNATGSAALLEVARLFRQLQFERSNRLIWFTGEEIGLLGSRAYVADYGDLDYRGVINLDMFGWDGDGDRCFEIHVGAIPESNKIGTCLVESIESYSHDLTYDYLTTGASGSDHYSFWYEEIGAIGVSENISDNSIVGGCEGADMNPYYHMVEDTIELNLTPSYAHDIALSAMESLGALAQAKEIQFEDQPTLTVTNLLSTTVSLSWTPVSGVERYRVFRSSFGCQDLGVKIGQTASTGWIDRSIRADWPYQYRVEAVANDGIHVSQISNCVAIGPSPPPEYHYFYFPTISR